MIFDVFSSWDSVLFDFHVFWKIHLGIETIPDRILEPDLEVPSCSYLSCSIDLDGSIIVLPLHTLIKFDSYQVYATATQERKLRLPGYPPHPECYQSSKASESLRQNYSRSSSPSSWDSSDMSMIMPSCFKEDWRTSKVRDYPDAGAQGSVFS